MFQSRLLALSRVHDVLTNESWEGANLGDIAAQAIIPYRDANPTRFAVNGPAVWLSAKMTLSISMALHELATNAVKYGALSNEKAVSPLPGRRSRSRTDGGCAWSGRKRTALRSFRRGERDSARGSSSAAWRKNSAAKSK